MKNLGLGFDLGKKMNRTQDCELVNGLSFTRPGGRAPVLRGRTAAGEDREVLSECRQSSATTAGVSQGREDRRSKTGHCRRLARRRGFRTGVAAAAPAAGGGVQRPAAAARSAQRLQLWSLYASDLSVHSGCLRDVPGGLLPGEP